MSTEQNKLNLEDMDKVAGGAIGFSTNETCPRCGSSNIDWEDHADDVEEFKGHCNACGNDFVVKVGG